MIIYKDILKKLKAAGYSSLRLRKEGLIGQAAIQSLRHGKDISMATLDKICDLTGLPINDLIEYVDSNPSLNYKHTLDGGRSNDLHS